MTRTELYTLLKLVEKAIESNKQNNRPLNECRFNPACDLVDLCHTLQEEYIESVRQYVTEV